MRKERLRYLLSHILFFGSFEIHLHVIFLQKIISVIIAIYSIASNEEFCITIIQLLQVWIAMVSSWLIVQVNFMTFLGEKITLIYYTQSVKTYSGQTDPLILHWWRDLWIVKWWLCNTVYLFSLQLESVGSDTHKQSWRNFVCFVTNYFRLRW